MENEKKKRKSTATIRRASTRGVIAQKAMTFRVDSVLVPYLEQEQNKGRLINNLLYEHYGVQP